MYLKRLYDHSKDTTCGTCSGSGFNPTYTDVLAATPDNLKDSVRQAFKCPTCSGRGVIPFVSGISVLRAKERQRFTQGLIDGGTAEGWLSIIRGNIVIHGEGGDVTYQIVRSPGGYFCCHCDQSLVDGNAFVDVGGVRMTRGQAHVAQAHSGAASPDPTNPAGYFKEDYYTCRLVGEGVAPSKDESAKMDREIHKGRLTKLGAKYRKGIVTAGALASLFILGVIVDHLLSSFFAVPGLMLAGDFVFNRSLGRSAELYRRVDINDPADAVIVIFLIAASGVESDAVLKDKDDLAALFSGATNEATNTGYARKILTDADIVAFAPDDTNDRVDLDIPDQTWTGMANDGTGAVSDLGTAYDLDSTGGTDSAIEPMTLHDFAITPDGSDVTVQIASAGFFRAA